MTAAVTRHGRKARWESTGGNRVRANRWHSSPGLGPRQSHRLAQSKGWSSARGALARREHLAHGLGGKGRRPWGCLRVPGSQPWSRRVVYCAPHHQLPFALLLGCVHVLGEGNLMRLVVKSFPPNVQLGCLGKRICFLNYWSCLQRTWRPRGNGPRWCHRGKICVWILKPWEGEFVHPIYCPPPFLNL